MPFTRDLDAKAYEARIEAQWDDAREEASMQARYGISIAQNRQLSGRDVGLLEVIGYFQHEHGNTIPTPSKAILARYVDVSKRTVERNLKRLDELGVLEKAKKFYLNNADLVKEELEKCDYFVEYVQEALASIRRNHKRLV